jgi:hypothetical protein
MRPNSGPHRIAAVAAASVLLATDAIPAAAQNVQLPMRRCQSYAGPATAGQTGFRSNEEAAAIVRQIAAHAGLAANFTVRPAETDGGAMAATCYDTGWRQIRRLVLYQPAFMAEIRQRSGSYWSLIGVLAHEIGHHANGHTLYRSWGHEKELEADRFAGFVMARMGATREQALSGIRSYGDPAAKATHPVREEREAAVEAGWRAAQPKLAQQAGTSAPPADRPQVIKEGNRRIIKVPPDQSQLP